MGWWNQEKIRPLSGGRQQEKLGVSEFHEVILFQRMTARGCHGLRLPVGPSPKGAGSSAL